MCRHAIKILQRNQIKLNKLITPPPITNYQILKYSMKGYMVIGFCFAIVGGYSLPKEEMLQDRIKYGCGVGICWPIVTFTMFAFTQN